MKLLIVIYMLCVYILYGCNSEIMKPKLIIDNDAGADDAMAIFLSLLYEKHFNGPEVIALTTGNGNTNEDNVCINNQKILKVAGRQDIPIYRGARSSLVVTPETNAYYGLDGLGDSGDVYTDLKPAKDQSAVSALIELSKTHKDNLIVVTIGTLTNVALAIKLDPDFLGRLSQLYIGAGHINSDQHPDAEFNAFMDVEAYRVITQHAKPDKVTVVPFSQVQLYLNYTNDFRYNVLGSIQSDIIKAQNKFAAVASKQHQFWHDLDPAVVAMAVKPDLVEEYKYSKHDIITCGQQRGINTNTFTEKEKANVRIIYSMKTEGYKQFLLDLFSK